MTVNLHLKPASAGAFHLNLNAGPPLLTVPVPGPPQAHWQGHNGHVEDHVEGHAGHGPGGAPGFKLGAAVPVPAEEGYDLRQGHVNQRVRHVTHLSVYCKFGTCHSSMLPCSAGALS
eukprot:557216-Rhodomonas_salina.1